MKLLFTILGVFVCTVCSTKSTVQRTYLPLENSAQNVTEFIRQLELNGKVYGGSKAAKGEFPYMLYMQTVYANKTLYCGASIIAPHYVLTAAHCIHQDLRWLRFLVGYTKLNKKSGGEYIVQGQMIVIPGYDRNTMSNDIAVIETYEPFRDTPLSKPVSLPAQGEPLPTGSAMVTGWGTTENGDGDELVKLSLRIRSDADCEKQFANYNKNTKLCAGDTEGQSICNGDSGSPLVANGKQIGIASFRVKPCSSPPGAFTRVAGFRDFIRREAGV